MLSVNCVFNASLPKTWEISSWLSYRKCHMHTVVDMFLIAPAWLSSASQTSVPLETVTMLSV